MRKSSKVYGGFSGGWQADALRMRGGWQAVIRSLNLTEKQEQAAISILEFIQTRGETDESRTLSHDQRSSKWWSCKFVTVYQLKKHFQEVTQKSEISYRYLWYAVDWLVMTGWLDERRRIEKNRAVRGYWFSDRVLRYAKRCEPEIPTLWEE
jgi:hypothetical protein